MPPGHVQPGAKRAASVGARADNAPSPRASVCTMKEGHYTCTARTLPRLRVSKLCRSALKRLTVGASSGSARRQRSVFQSRLPIEYAPSSSPTAEVKSAPPDRAIASFGLVFEDANTNKRHFSSSTAHTKPPARRSSVSFVQGVRLRAVMLLDNASRVTTTGIVASAIGADIPLGEYAGLREAPCACWPQRILKCPKCTVPYLCLMFHISTEKYGLILVFWYSCAILVHFHFVLLCSCAAVLPWRHRSRHRSQRRAHLEAHKAQRDRETHAANYSFWLAHFFTSTSTVNRRETTAPSIAWCMVGAMDQYLCLLRVIIARESEMRSGVALGQWRLKSVPSQLPAGVLECHSQASHHHTYTRIMSFTIEMI